MLIFQRVILLLIVQLSVLPLGHAASIHIEAKDAFIYDTWLPENGTTVDLLVSVSDYNHSSGEIQFRFTEVSNWPGTCMNAGTGTKQDLCLYGQSKDVFASVADARAGTKLSNVSTAHLTWETRADGTTQARFSYTSDAKIPDTFTIGLEVTCERGLWRVRHAPSPPL